MNSTSGTTVHSTSSSAGDIRRQSTRESFTELAGRILLASVFSLLGLGKLGAYSATAAYMSSVGVPLYAQLKPIADAVSNAAQPRYNHPFKFYLVHEAQPNAFATRGGNVYVVDSLLYFVKNADELAGTLCHEVSHTIHHDTMTLMEKRKKVAEREAGAAILLGPTTGHVLAIALLGQLHSLSYSRDVEARADLTGADVCAAAGYNPWGLVWLFRDFDNADIAQIPQILSDHPNNQNRAAALEQYFRENPSVFGKFNPDRGAAAIFAANKSAPVVFLR